MTSRPRGLRAQVVRALSRVGLVWALAVLGVLFVADGARGQVAAATLGQPRVAGLALVVVVLAVGLAVLALGSLGPDHGPEDA